MRSSLRSTAIAFACTLLASASGSMATADAQEILRPGDPSLTLERLRLGTDSSQIRRFVGGAEQEGPLQIQSTERIERGGEDVLRITFTLEADNGNLYDTAYARLPSLEPITHKSRPAPGGPWRSLDLEYGPTGVAGELTEPDSAPRSLDLPLEQKVFDTSLSTVLFSVMPLAPGYEVRVPFLEYNSMEVTHHTYRVLGESELPFRGDMVEVWDMELELPTGMKMQMKVAKESRAVVRGEMSMGGGNRVVIAPPGA